MRKINTIVKGIANVQSAERKASRIMRQIDQAIDMAKDRAQDAQDKADELITKLGQYGGAEQTEELCSALNNYQKTLRTKKEWEECAAIYTQLKKELSEEVPVEE